MKTELKHKYWEVMPLWMKEAYQSDPVVYSEIQKCLHLELEPQEMLLKVGEACFRAYRHHRNEFLRKAMDNPKFWVIS